MIETVHIKSNSFLNWHLKKPNLASQFDVKFLNKKIMSNLVIFRVKFCWKKDSSVDKASAPTLKDPRGRSSNPGQGKWQILKYNNELKEARWRHRTITYHRIITRRKIEKTKFPEKEVDGATDFSAL